MITFFQLKNCDSNNSSLSKMPFNFLHIHFRLCHLFYWALGSTLVRIKIHITRMHSSRMRTGRSWTVCWSQHPGGGVCQVPGGGSAWPRGGGGVSAWSRGVVCQVLGGSAWSQGGCLIQGGMTSQHALRQTSSPPRGQTDTCKNITLATTSLRPVNICKYTQLLHSGKS